MEIDLAGNVRAALLPEGSVRVTLEGGDLVLEGEVADLPAKKLALERAAAAPGAGHIVDRLRVRPAAPADDAHILSHVQDLLSFEHEFEEVRLAARMGSARSLVHDGGPHRTGEIEVSVRDGVVTLDGEVPSLSHKRLAGALAWWVAGTRDVVNGLGVDPPEEDGDAELVEAIHLVLETDPLVDAARFGIVAVGGVVTLTGLARSPGEKSAAEFDAWCVFGVDRVESRIEDPRAS